MSGTTSRRPFAAAAGSAHAARARMSLLVALALTGAAGCQGADVGTSTVVARQDVVVLDAGDVEPPSQSHCEVDSDCAALSDAPCVAARCDVASGRCTLGARPPFATCDDGEPCTAESFCLGGTCLGGRATPCDDGNPCTRDQCTQGVGCTAKPVTLSPCSDDNPCTVDDHCDAGTCVATENLCGCAEDSDCGALQDLCSSGYACVSGGCVPQQPKGASCDDGNPCTMDHCDPKQGCLHVQEPNGTLCADNDVCTTAERCVGGVCTAAGKLPCGASGLCAASACDAIAGCTATAAEQGVPCDDGDACTAGENCKDGVCAGTSTCGCERDADCASADLGPACAGAPVCRLGRCALDPAQASPCDPADQACLVVLCTATGCVAKPLPQYAACDDDNECTGGDYCDNLGVCKGATTITCNDGVDCTADLCVPSTGCLYGPSSLTLPCDDGNACTSDDVCEGLQCRGVAGGCDDGDPCTTDFCQPVIAACAHAQLANGATCLDGDPCTLGERCLDGLCLASKVLGCDDGNPCTDDICTIDGACDHPAAAAKTTCDDGDSCTEGDSCADGACVGGANVCACKSAAECAASEDGDLCNGTLICVDNVCVVDPGTIVACPLAQADCIEIACAPKTGQCVEVAAKIGALCDDGDACTSGERCLSGATCAGGDAVPCDDQDSCTSDSCDPAKGCVFNAGEGGTGAPCDDGNPCTFGDTCGAKGCVPGVSSCQCTKDADCAAYDDTDLCTPALACNKGACLPSAPPVVCNPGLGSPCVDHVCLPSTGLCTLVPRTDGAACKVGNGVGCQGAGTCASAQCLTGAQIACDDGDVCTADSCGSDGACAHVVASGSACDDGDDCTVGDTCDASGSCAAGGSVCECKVDADCVDDEDLCNGVPYCLANTCQTKPGTEVVCSTAGDTDCSKTSCVAKTGACTKTLAADASPCDDGNACTFDTACKSGVCAGGGEISCDDGILCTSDGCNPAKGCFALPNTVPCDDGDPCTLGDACANGVCKGGAQCECLLDVDCKDDGNLCNGKPSCDSGLCVVKQQSVVVCDPSQDGPCAANLCDPFNGTCAMEPFPTGTACSDGDGCTVQDQCKGGVCGGTPFACDDNNVCTTDSCDPITGCANTANNAACDDGDVCTEQDVCASGSCQPGKTVCTVCQTDGDCNDDGNPCTTPACSPSTKICGFVDVDAGTPCTDADFCTSASACANGFCVGTATIDCSDGNPCTSDGCNATTGCNHAALSAAPCDDGNACTNGDSCTNGSCAAGTNTCACQGDADCLAIDPNLCDGTLACIGGGCVPVPGSAVVCDASANTSCSKATCQPTTGICVPVSVADGTSCATANDPCLTPALCVAGLCTGATPIDCSDDVTCTDDACAADGSCLHTANDAACDDGNVCTKDACAVASGCSASAAAGQACDDSDLCTSGETCQDSQDGVVCGGGAIDTCQDGNACTIDSCDPQLGCAHEPLPAGTTCDDGNACTDGDTCANGGLCLGGPVNCDDGNLCTVDACTADGGCTFTLAAIPCDDGQPCTSPDSCNTAGLCVGTAISCDDGNPCTADGCDNTAGGCIHTVLNGYSNDFTVGSKGISFQSSNAQIRWTIDTKRASSPDQSLYVGNINDLTGVYSYNFGLTLATATLPSVAIPAGVSTAFVRAKVYFDSGETGACTPIADRVAWVVGGAEVTQVCGDTNGFVTLEADLKAQAGTVVAPALRFLANPFQNVGQGAWIDDVEVGWTCGP